MLGNVVTARHCGISEAKIDKNVYITASSTAGYNIYEDRKHFRVSPGYVVVVPKVAEVT